MQDRAAAQHSTAQHSTAQHITQRSTAHSAQRIRRHVRAKHTTQAHLSCRNTSCGIEAVSALQNCAMSSLILPMVFFVPPSAAAAAAAAMLSPPPPPPRMCWILKEYSLGSRRPASRYMVAVCRHQRDGVAARSASLTCVFLQLLSSHAAAPPLHTCKRPCEQANTHTHTPA
jgi:hypothetical protein